MSKKTTKLIIISTIILFMLALIGRIGADERALKNVLRLQGYTKCGDGIYRSREIKEEGNEIIMYDRTFDIKKNYGESHITVLFKRVDGKKIKESEIVELAEWNFDEQRFEPVN